MKKIFAVIMLLMTVQLALGQNPTLVYTTNGLVNIPAGTHAGKVIVGPTTAGANNGDVFTFDAASGFWKPAAPSGGGGGSNAVTLGVAPIVVVTANFTNTVSFDGTNIFNASGATNLNASTLLFGTVPYARLPVNTATNIVAGSGILVTSASGVYTISTNGFAITGPFAVTNAPNFFTVASTNTFNAPTFTSNLTVNGSSLLYGTLTVSNSVQFLKSGLTYGFDGVNFQMGTNNGSGNFNFEVRLGAVATAPDFTRIGSFSGGGTTFSMESAGDAQVVIDNDNNSTANNFFIRHNSTNGGLLYSITESGVATNWGNLIVTNTFTATGLKYPLVDGSSNQVVSTDGAGNLSLKSLASLGAGDVFTISNNTFIVSTTNTFNGLISVSNLNVLGGGNVVLTNSPTFLQTRTATIGITIDGGGSVLSTGQKGYFSVPYSGIITAFTILADQSGSCVIDVWKTNSPIPTSPIRPVASSTITAADIPTLSSSATTNDSTLTGWTTTFATNDVFGFNVNSASTVTRATLTLTIRKN